MNSEMVDYLKTIGRRFEHRFFFRVSVNIEKEIPLFYSPGL